MSPESIRETSMANQSSDDSRSDKSLIMKIDNDTDSLIQNSLEDTDVHEDFNADEFKDYLKRVKNCLAGLSRGR